MANLIWSDWKEFLIWWYTVDLDADTELQDSRCEDCNKKILRWKQQIIDSLLWTEKHTPRVFQADSYRTSLWEWTKIAWLIITFFKEQEKYRSIIKDQKKISWIDVEATYFAWAINVANILAQLSKEKEVQEFWIRKIDSLLSQRKISLSTDE